MCLNLYIPYEKPSSLSLKFSNSWRQLANQVRDAQVATYVVSFTPNTTRLREGMSEALLLSQELSCICSVCYFRYLTCSLHSFMCHLL